MDMIELADTGLRSSRLVLGTMTFGSQVDQATAAEMVGTCLDHGVNHFDTANAYSGGASEEILGAALAGRRDEALVASKVGSPGAPGAGARPLADEEVVTSLEASLRRLGTDYLDLFYLHTPDWRTPIDETMGAMSRLVEEGKVRAISVSNYAAWQICELHHKGGREGWPPVRISQPQYNLVSRRLDEEYAAFSSQYGIANLTYSPLAGGLLSGKHRFDEEPATGTRFTWDSYRERYWNATQFEAVERLTEIAAEAGMSLPELAFRWLLNRPIVTGVILGASKLTHLEANIEMARAEALEDDVMTACDEVWSAIRGVGPNYNR
jgi:aryl-alcohol dehydrogenase-like predicted oxidoreductase